MGAPGRSAPTPEWIRDPWRLGDGVRSIRLDPSLRGPEDLGRSRRCLLRLPGADADAAGSGPPHRGIRALAHVRRRCELKGLSLRGLVLVDREIVEVLPGSGPLPPPMDPWLEQGRDAAIEEGNHRTLLLDGDPVRLVEQRQAGGAGFLGKRTVDQLIEWGRRPTLRVAGTAAV